MPSVAVCLSMYDEETLDTLRTQLQQTATQEPYQTALADIDIETMTWASFADVPFLTPAELKAAYEANPPEGTLAADGSMLSFTPMGDELRPVFDTTDDLAAQAAANASVLERAGIEPGDRVLNTFGYHTFGTGIVFHRGIEALGAEVIPAGPGDSAAAADTIETYDVDALVGNPSYALKIAEQGGRVDRFVGAGEPFTAVPGLRERVRNALGAKTATDYFGTRQILPVAAETTAENGLVVADDYAVVEVVDPDSGERQSPGERGELVVTHLAKDGVPLVRYRTGDLAVFDVRDGQVVLPDGVIGRTDERLKVKGVKLYPESLGTVLAGFDDLTGDYRIEVSRPDSTDYLRVVCEGDAELAALTDAIADRLVISPDAVDTTPELDESGVADDRY